MNNKLKECSRLINELIDKFGLETVNLSLINYIKQKIRFRKKNKLKYEDLSAIEEQYSIVSFFIRRKTQLWSYLKEFHYWY